MTTETDILQAVGAIATVLASGMAGLWLGGRKAATREAEQKALVSAVDAKHQAAIDALHARVAAMEAANADLRAKGEARAAQVDRLEREAARSMSCAATHEKIDSKLLAIHDQQLLAPNRGSLDQAFQEIRSLKDRVAGNETTAAQSMARIEALLLSLTEKVDALARET